MEALVLIIAEFLLAPLIVSITLVGNLFAALISSVFGLIFQSFGAKHKRPKNAHLKEAQKEEKRNKFPAIVNWLKRITLLFFALITIVLLVVNYVLFEATAKYLLLKVSQKTGIEVEAEEVSGNIFTGAVVFHNLIVKREADNKSSFDFKVENVAVDINIWSLILQPITLESLSVKNIEGKIEQPKKNWNDSTAEADTAGKIKSKRVFIVERLNLNDINVMLSKRNKAPVEISLQEVRSVPFRSNYAIFDIFFRSNISGALNRHEISISTEEIESGRLTKWNIEALPVATISNFVTKPPIGWLKGGVIDVEVEDSWQLDQKVEIDMDWRIHLQGVKAEVPINAGLIERTISTPIVKYINAKNEDIDFSFTLLLNEKQFENAASLDASGIWDAVVKSMAKSIALHTKHKAEEVEQGIGNAVRGFRGFLDRRHKPAE